MGWWIAGLTRAHKAAIEARMWEMPPAERRRIKARAGRAAFRDRRVHSPFGVAVVLLAVGIGLMLHRPAHAPLTEVVVSLAAYVGSLIAATFGLPAYDRLVRRHLAAEFPTLCPTCGYDRRATPNRCPECGTESPTAPDVGT